MQEQPQGSAREVVITRIDITFMNLLVFSIRFSI